MDLEHHEHCLFCLDTVVSVQKQTTEDSEKSSSFNGNNDNGKSRGDSCEVQNFKQLCEYLKVEFPRNSLKFKNVSRLLLTESKSCCCESLLCASCLEMVNRLSWLYDDLRRVQRKIDFRIRTIQSVVRESDKDDEGDKTLGDGGLTWESNATLPLEENGDGIDKPDRCQKRKKMDFLAAAASSSIGKDYVEFVTTFRTLLKDVKTQEPEPLVLSEEGKALAEMYQNLEQELENNPLEQKIEDGESSLTLSQPQILQKESIVNDPPVFNLFGHQAIKAHWLQNNNGNTNEFNILSTVDATVEKSNKDTAPAATGKAVTLPLTIGNESGTFSKSINTAKNIRKPSTSTPPQSTLDTALNPFPRFSSTIPSTKQKQNKTTHPATSITLPAYSNLFNVVDITPVTPVPTEVNVIHICPHCLDVKTFKNKNTLENHIRIHHDTTVQKHKCGQCDKAFVHRSTLRHHIQQIHLGIRYKCRHCPKSFTAKSLLKQHLKLHDGEGPPVLTCTCTCCEKLFASLTALKTHMATQHGPNDPVNCEICGKTCLNLYCLRAHKSDVHNLKQYSCPRCPLKFARLNSFERHLKTHFVKETNIINAVQMTEEEEEGEWPFTFVPVENIDQ